MVIMQMVIFGERVVMMMNRRTSGERMVMLETTNKCGDKDDKRNGGAEASACQ